MARLARTCSFELAAPPAYRFELIFDPATGAVLGSRTVALDPLPIIMFNAGTVVFSWAYTRSCLISTDGVPGQLKQIIA